MNLHIFALFNIKPKYLLVKLPVLSQSWPPLTYQYCVHVSVNIETSGRVNNSKYCVPNDTSEDKSQI